MGGASVGAGSYASDTSMSSASMHDTSMSSVGSTSDSAQGVSQQEDASGVLDQELTLMRRKTIAIKSDNVQDAILSNMNVI